MHNTVWKVSKNGPEKAPYMDTFDTSQYTNRESNTTFLELLDFSIFVSQGKCLLKSMLKPKKW